MGGRPHPPPSPQMGHAPAPVWYMICSTNNHQKSPKCSLTTSNALIYGYMTPHPYKKIALLQHFLKRLTSKGLLLTSIPPTPIIKKSVRDCPSGVGLVQLNFSQAVECRMSGGGGSKRQMPMASNQGQQMGVQPQMGMAPQSGMFGQPQLNQQQQQAFDQMRQSNFLAPQGPQGPFETPQPMPQVVGMPMQTNQPYTAQGVPASMVDQTPFAFDQQSRAAFDQQQKMADLYGRSDGGMQLNQPNQPYAMPGQPMGDGQPMFGGKGIQDLFRQNQMQRQQARAAYDKSLMDLQNGSGMAPGGQPGMGAIDGRSLINALDITKRRNMSDPPSAIGNNLPQSLKRPTQGGVRGSKP